MIRNEQKKNIKERIEYNRIDSEQRIEEEKRRVNRRIDNRKEKRKQSEERKRRER